VSIAESKEIYKLYKDAAKVTKCCSLQRYAFDFWRKHRHKTEYTLAFDTETTGIHFGVPTMLHIGNTDVKVPNITAFGISLAIPTKNRIILVWARIGTKLFNEAADLLRTPGLKTAHNARYDWRVLKTDGIEIAETVHCTLAQARLFWDRRQSFSLQSLSEFICPEISDWEDEVKSEVRKIKSSYTRKGYPKDYTNYSFVDDKIMSKYSMTDSFLCLILHNMLYPRMQDTYAEVYQRESKIMRLALKIEFQNLQYDTKRSLKEERKLINKATKLESKMHQIANKTFNAKSPAQLINVLCNNLNIPKNLITKNNTLSTDKTLLESIIDEHKWKDKRGIKFIKTLLNFRAINKILSGYLQPLRIRAKHNNGKLFCNINTTDTRTGRMAVKDPALQTIPRILSKRKRVNPVRACFVCKPGRWNYHFDFKQIEMIFYALLIGDTHLINTYNNKKDIYTEIASYAVSEENLQYIRDNLGDPRQQLKQLSLAIIYGAGITGTAKILQMPRQRAASLLYDYLDACPLVNKYRRQCEDELFSRGYVEDFFGRKYHVEQSQAYKAANAVVQGSCAQILKIAMLNVDEYLCDNPKEQARIILPIHDEIMLDRPYKYKDTELVFCRDVVKAMQNIPQLKNRGLTLQIDIERTKTNWEAKQKIDI